MKEYFIILLCFAPLIVGQSPDTTRTCIVDFLKNKGYIQHKQKLTKTLSSDCLNIIESKKSASIEKLREDLSSTNAYKNNSECIIESLKETELFDKSVVRFVDVLTSPILSDRKITAMKANLDIETSNKVSRAHISCNADKLSTQEIEDAINDDFKKFFTGDKNIQNDIDQFEDYCVRKHMLDKNLITFNRDKLNVNPKNLDTSTIDCTSIYPTAVKKLEEKTKKNIRKELKDSEQNEPLNWIRCLMDKLRKEKYFDKNLQYEYAKELNMTEEQKEKLRVQFLFISKEFLRTYIACMHQKLSKE